MLLGCGCLAAVMLPVLVGIGVARLPFIRRIGRANPALKRTKSVLMGLLAFGITFGIYAYRGVEIFFFTDDGMPPDPEAPFYVDPAEIERYGGSLRFELWLRMITPPESSPECYSSRAAVCQMADTLNLRFHPSGAPDSAVDPFGWQIYRPLVIAGLISACICGVLVQKTT
jgi:hypothetical protein